LAGFAFLLAPGFFEGIVAQARVAELFSGQ
jgi:hypothetical protein